jgi:uncharacterized protein YukE
MERTMEALLGVVKQLDTKTDELYREVRATLGDEWEGEVRTIFEEGKAKWDKAEVEMVNQLNQAAQAIGVANSNYQAAEARNRAIWMD